MSYENSMLNNHDYMMMNAYMAGISTHHHEPIVKYDLISSSWPLHIPLKELIDDQVSPYVEENTSTMPSMAHQETFLDEVLDIAIGLPLDVIRAGVYVEECISLFAKVMVCGSSFTSWAYSGPLSRSLSVTETFLFSGIVISFASCEFDDVFQILTLGLAAASIFQLSVSPALLMVANDAAAYVADYLVNDTFLSNCSYFDLA